MVKNNKNEQTGSIFVKTIISELEKPENSVKDVNIEFMGSTMAVTFFELSILNKNWFIKFLMGKQFENEIIDLEIDKDSPEAFSGYENETVYIKTVYNFSKTLPIYCIYKDGGETA